MIQKAGAALDVWSPARSPEANIAAAAQADIGITGADFAVANTGTLALFSGSEQGRSISLLPLTHIAIFHKSALVPRLGLVLNRVKEMEAQGLEPSSLNFITGPSRSSDIEGQSVRGVHGPGNVIAMILDFDT
jgi:L-lactate dehydrogenase complex protein LldG